MYHLMGTSAENGQKFIIYLKTQTWGCFLEEHLPGSCVLPNSSHPHHPCNQTHLGFLNHHLFQYFSGPQVYQRQNSSPMLQSISGASDRQEVADLAFCNLQLQDRWGQEWAINAHSAYQSPPYFLYPYLKSNSQGCLLTVVTDPRTSANPWLEGLNTSWHTYTPERHTHWSSGGKKQQQTSYPCLNTQKTTTLNILVYSTSFKWKKNHLRYC